MPKAEDESSGSKSPLLVALQSHQVTAEVTDLDLHRIGGGLAVETDYIVTVKAIATTNQTPVLSFDPFTLSKSYSAFRALASHLKRVADHYTSSSSTSYQGSSKVTNEPPLPREAIKCAKYCELVSHLIESQKTQYLGKVNFVYVKSLSQQRSRILNDVLDATCSYFPEGNLQEHALLGEVASIIETFFLTDHCEATQNPNTVEGSSSPSAAHHVKKLSLDSQALLTNLLGRGNNPKTPAGTPSRENVVVKKPSRLFKRASSDAVSAQGSTNSSGSIVVQPMSRKARKSDDVREKEEQELVQAGQNAQLVLESENQPSRTASPGKSVQVSGSVRPVRKKTPDVQKSVVLTAVSSSYFGLLFQKNPTIFLGIAGLSVYLVHQAGSHVVSVDGDVALLTLFAAFCLGLHLPRPMDESARYGGTARPARSGMVGTSMIDSSGRLLLRRMSAPTSATRQSMLAAASAAAGMETMLEELDDEDEEEEVEHALIIGSPLPMFPLGAKIGSHNNCWSEPDPGNFSVRGPNYFADKKKIGSEEFVFPTRGIDLFLTDTCPENVGSNSSMFGGNLRQEPTFIINFRLPWGVLVFYFAIPEMFLPFVQAGHDPNYDKSSLPSLAKMSAGDRTVCRFLMGSTEYKNETLKIVPVVVDGPWVVKQVVGGKPAIIGTKLPVKYIFQPAEGDKHMYLEADLDIAASSAARGILSVARSYTQILTLDLGFVVQANKEDELPERMLVGTRIHGVDPLTAPSLPPMKTMFMDDELRDDDDDTASIVTPVVMQRD